MPELGKSEPDQLIEEVLGVMKNAEWCIVEWYTRCSCDSVSVGWKREDGESLPWGVCHAPHERTRREENTMNTLIGMLIEETVKAAARAKEEKDRADKLEAENKVLKTSLRSMIATM